MTAATYSKTFAKGFTVRIQGDKIWTNDPNQKAWWNIEGIAASVRTLAKFSPAGISQNDIIALAVQQTRAAWLGAEEIRAISKGGA